MGMGNGRVEKYGDGGIKGLLRLIRVEERKFTE